MVPSIRALVEGCLIMARLLITLDGVQVGEREVDKDRLTIGRRAHNDIVLDHIGVSGEHAAVVTILNDSFLEDLGSTNGTLVNGSPVRKHFLRNGDLVEVGRHKLRFFGEVAATREAADFEKTMVLNRPAVALRGPVTGDVRSATVSGWTVQESGVEPALARASATEAAQATLALTQAEPHAVAAVSASPDLAAEAALSAAVATANATAMPAGNAAAVVAALAQYLPPMASSETLSAAPDPLSAAADHAADAGFPALPTDGLDEPAAAGPLDAAPTQAADDAAEATLVTVVAQAKPMTEPAGATELPLTSQVSTSGADVVAAVAASAMVPLRGQESPARLQVLNGTAAGRILEINKSLTTIGRPGVQVAVISRRSDGYYLAQVDGAEPARLNGNPLVPHAVALHAHDVLEIAGIKLEFFFQI